MSNQVYKECSHCGKITEDNEERCPDCGQNPFLEKLYSQEEIIDKIKKREIPLHRLKIKHWEPFIFLLPKGSPS